LKRKIIAVLMLLAVAVLFTVDFASAAQVTGSINADHAVILTHQSVTLTCTYTTTLGVQGKGTLQVSNAGDPSDPDTFDTWTDVHYWDGGTGTKHSGMLTSGVPVTFTKQLDATGYYKFRWLCQGGGVDGAFTEVTVQVVDTTPLPEAPPIAAFAVGFAAVGMFIYVAKRKTVTPTTKF
jgi:hypothetical protein